MLFWFSALRGDVHPRGEGIRQRCSSDHARYPCGQPGKPTVSVKIKASKTDPFHQGVLVYVGRTNQPLCPVSELLVYMVRRATGQGPCSSSRMAGLSQGYVLPLRSGRLCWQLGLARSPILGIFCLLGLPPLLLGQKKKSRKSSAYQLYIKTPRDHLASISRKQVAQRQQLVSIVL